MVPSGASCALPCAGSFGGWGGGWEKRHRTLARAVQFNVCEAQGWQRRHNSKKAQLLPEQRLQFDVREALGFDALSRVQEFEGDALTRRKSRKIPVVPHIVRLLRPGPCLAARSSTGGGQPGPLLRRAIDTTRKAIEVAASAGNRSGGCAVGSKQIRLPEAGIGGACAVGSKRIR